MNILNYIHYIINYIIIIICVYLYYKGSLTLNRIIIFIIVFLMIYGYSRLPVLMGYIFSNSKVQKYIQDHKTYFHKILLMLLNIYRWINPFIVLLAYTDKCLYWINRYVTNTSLVHYNFIIYVLMKYYVMLGLIKLLIHKYYNFWFKLGRLTIVEILFKRMYGLVLSILIFTDVLNYIIGVLSQYSVWIYVLIYYVISTFCVMWELLYFYYLEYKIKLKYKKLAYIIILFNENFKTYTKINIILTSRLYFLWFGRVISNLFKILVPEESNFQEDFLHIMKIREGTFLWKAVYCIINH